jgi:hypothetical protein
MNKEIIKKALIGSKDTVNYIYIHGYWPKGTFKQYENLIVVLNDALKELDKDDG